MNLKIMFFEDTVRVLYRYYITPLIALLSQRQYIRNYFLCIPSPMEQIECLKNLLAIHIEVLDLRDLTIKGRNFCRKIFLWNLFFAIASPKTVYFAEFIFVN